METDNESFGSGSVERNVECDAFGEKLSKNFGASASRQTFRLTQPNNEKRTAAGVKISGFMDLDVYRNSYSAMIMIFKRLLPILPKEERFDLRDQIFRSAKAIPRLIAEGHSKRHQNKGFQKYIDDAHAESNETIVSICQIRDIYASVEMKEVCNKLIDDYDKISRQLYKLAIAWDKFHQREKTL